MEVLKRIGTTLLDYYDKMVLGILLLLLASVMVMQSCNMKQTIQNVETAKRSIHDELPNKKMPPIDETWFDIDLEIDQSLLWQPVPADRDRPALPRSASLAKRRHIRSTGAEGSLFDPPVYVFSSHAEDIIVHYRTRLNPYTNRPEDRPLTGEIDEGPAEEDPETGTEVARPRTPIIQRIRFYRTRQRYLPFILRNITATDPMNKNSWQLQINVSRRGGTRTQFLKIGDEIEGYTGYQIIDADYKKELSPGGMVIETASMTLRTPTSEDPVVARKGSRIPAGQPIYQLVILPEYRGQSPDTISVDGDKPFAVGPAGDRVYLKVISATTAGATIQRVSSDGAVVGSPRSIDRFNPAELRNLPRRPVANPEDVPMMPIEEQPTP